MNLLQVDAICKQAMQVKRQGRTLEARQMLEDCIRACESDVSDELCFAALYKSLAKLYYVQRDFLKAKDLYFRAIDVFISHDLKDEAGTCLMHLGTCSEEFVRSKFFQTYLWSLETGSYAGVPQEVAIGIGQLGMKLGVSMYNERSEQKES